MAVYKVTTMWNQSIMGVSESYYTPDVNPTEAIRRLQRYLSARFNLLDASQFMVGVRVALYGSKRQSVVLLPPADIWPGTVAQVQIPTNGSFKGGPIGDTPDQLRAVLQTRVSYSNTRTAIRYMSGIPDSISRTEPATTDFPRNVAWKQAFDQYCALVANDGWQIRALANTGPNAPASVIGVTSQAAAPSLLGIVIQAATAPPIVQGSQVNLQHFRPAKFTRSATINGRWTVDSVNATLIPGSLIVYLRNSGTIDPATVRLTAESTISLVGYSLFPVQNLTWIRVGVHKRGRPSMAPRGRRLTRPTLDP